jgi:hypothetical protein
LDQFQYGLSPYDITSQHTIPKLHTSEADVNLRKAMASGAVHLTGILPPWNKYIKNEINVTVNRQQRGRKRAHRETSNSCAVTNG